MMLYNVFAGGGYTKRILPGKILWLFKTIYPQTSGILNGKMPFVPSNTNTNPMIIPRIRPPIKYLNSMMPSCPFLSILLRKPTTYINVFRKVYKWEVESIVNRGV